MGAGIDRHDRRALVMDGAEESPGMDGGVALAMTGAMGGQPLTVQGC